MGVCLIYILATLELLQSAVVGDIISRGCATLALLLRTVHIKSSYMTIFLLHDNIPSSEAQQMTKLRNR